MKIVNNFDYWYWFYFLFMEVKIEQNGMEQNKTEENAVIPESCIHSQDPKTKLLGRDYYVDDSH